MSARHSTATGLLVATLLTLLCLAPTTATAAPALTLDVTKIAPDQWRAEWTVDNPAAVLSCTLARGDSVEAFDCPTSGFHEFHASAAQGWRYTVRAATEDGQWSARWYEVEPAPQPPADEPTTPPSGPQPPTVEPPAVTDAPGVFMWPRLPSFGSVNVTRSGIYQLPARCTARNPNGRQSGICQATLSVFAIKPGKRPGSYRRGRRLDYGSAAASVGGRPTMRRLYLRGLARRYGRRVPVLAVLYHPSSGLTQSARGVLRLPRHDPPRPQEVTRAH